MNLVEFIKGFSEDFSVHRIDDITEGTVMKHIKADVYLIKNGDVTE